MSRSYKKNMGGRITCTESDKQDKKIWHRQARSMINQQMRRFEKDTEDNEAFLTYDDASYSDTWCWSSDGGSYLQYTDEQLTSKFNEEFNSGDMWSDYNFTKHKLSTWWFGILIRQCFTSNLKTEAEFNNFIINNQSDILKTWKKINYGK